MTHWETVLEPLHLSVALGESFARGGLRISFSGPGAPVCVCICVCVCETEREKEEGKSDFLFPSLRVGLLQGSGKQSALSLAVCVCVCVCVFMCGGRARCPRRTEFALMKTLPSPLMPRSLRPEV